MKSTATSICGQTKAEPARSHAGKPSLSTSPMGHLAAAINGSPGVEALAQLQGGIQQSPRMQSLMGLAAAIGHPAPAQPRAKPEQPTASASPVQAVAHCPAQLTQDHARTFITEKELGIEANSEAVTNYINDSANPVALRRGLLRAWNKNQISLHVIATPADLETTSEDVISMEDLSAWHSDDEDDWNLEKIKESREKGKVDLERSGEEAGPSGVSEMDFLEAIRLGRQVVKRDDYGQLPITTSLGGHYFEYSNPGTKDIYATPLEEVAQDSPPKKKGKTKSHRKFKRTGTSKDFNWRSLAGNLAKRGYVDSSLQMKRILRFFLSKGKTEGLDRETAEAIAAIGSDLMKGSAGGRSFLRKALARIESGKDKYGFKELFSGKNPVYEPAAVGGRALVRSAHSEFQVDANRLLGVNNCLINAIAQASLGRMANLGELIRIREQLQNYGEMLVASPETVQLIKQVLGIQNAIQVVYAYVDLPAEDFDDTGPLLTIYHVNLNHFTHILPSDAGGKKKKKKKTK